MPKLLKNALVIGLSVLVTVLVVRWVSAGTLDPNAGTAPTMVTFQNIYDASVGTFNSATSTASATGTAIQIARCIAQRIAGGTCP
jgi:hypothetical protein